jgi:DNA mismatch endonuclease (patch repair protein)
MDPLSPNRRSENMRRIRSVHTKPELIVRRLIHTMGYRYRLHAKDLPGRPDLVFRGRQKVIFVHGCFWHMHGACREGRIPSSNASYWSEKLKRNVLRDEAHRAELKRMGWKVLEIWECEIENSQNLATKVRRFLGPT